MVEVRMRIVELHPQPLGVGPGPHQLAFEICDLGLQRLAVLHPVVVST